MNGSTLRVASRYGAFFDTEVPEGFDLSAFIQDVRAKGYYFNSVVYVPHDTIAFITLMPPGVTDPLASHMPMPQGQTRQ